MLVTIDKRGSLNIPTAIRKQLGIKTGSHFELTIEPGGTICLHPVVIYRTIRLNEKGLSKLQQARESEASKLPDWMLKDMGDAEVDSE